MGKSFRIFASMAVCGSLALGGCSRVADGINSITGALSSPNAVQAAANVKAFAVAFVSGACVLTNLITGSGVNITQIQLVSKGVDPTTSKTLARWQAGAQISQSECGLVAQAITGGKVAVSPAS